MSSKTLIAGKKTVTDWLELKSKIEKDFKSKNLWEQAFTFFDERLQTRYIKPIETIQNSFDSNITGEGFAISAIICTLIEALESFYQGKNYKYLKRKEKLKEYEYNRSSAIFADFLTKREPFKQSFSKRSLAKEFYRNVRCSLLHEACTKNGWVIRIDTKLLIEKDNNTYILNRVLLLEQVKEYMSKYKSLLLDSKDLKQAFIRKMDYLVEIA